MFLFFISFASQNRILCILSFRKLVYTLSFDNDVTRNLKYRFLHFSLLGLSSCIPNARSFVISWKYISIFVYIRSCGQSRCCNMHWSRYCQVQVSAIFLLFVLLFTYDIFFQHFAISFHSNFKIDLGLLLSFDVKQLYLVEIRDFLKFWMTNTCLVRNIKQDQTLHKQEYAYVSWRRRT